MTQEFPNIENGQVVLARCVLNTGHVLDENLRIALEKDQRVYTVFEDIESALRVANEIVSENGGVECWIYDYQETVIACVNKINK